MVVHSGHIIKLSDAVALLGDFPALAGLDLTVAKGEVVAVEGPNGAGKSTLLRLCAGLLPLHTGTGVILDKDLSNRDERRELRRKAGLLAHETFLYDELSILENITFWARANRSDLSTIDPILDRLGLDGRLRTVKARDLSAGQRRRTSLAIMVSRRPHIWLLDEPHAALDKKGKDAVDSLVKQAVGFGATVLVASHDHERARSIATRVVVVSGGRIVEDGTSRPISSSEAPPAIHSVPGSSGGKAPTLNSRPVAKGFVNNSAVRDHGETVKFDDLSAEQDADSKLEASTDKNEISKADSGHVVAAPSEDGPVEDLFADLLEDNRPPSIRPSKQTTETANDDDWGA